MKISDGKMEIPESVKSEMKKVNNADAVISVYRRVDEMLEEYNVEKQNFYAIRNAQKIPDKIALDFLSVKGEIHDIDFLKRLKSE